jgi:hypothetical protein
MAINVYWACLEEEWMRAEAPAPVLAPFVKTHSNERSVISCPSIRTALSNVYSIKSIYDYEFSFVNTVTLSDMYTQEFFDKHVITRNLSERLFSFSQEFIFFTDSPSLMITGNLMPYMERNNITKNCIPVPGSYDIGKWFRPVEFAFFMPEDIDTFKVEQGEIFQYVQFHTDEKINLIQFRPSEQILKILKETMLSRKNKKFATHLEYFYKTFKLKKQLLSEIKGNTI